MTTYLASLEVNDFPHSREKRSQKLVVERWFEEKKEGDAVNGHRRRSLVWIGEGGEYASDVDFRRHTSKVLGE